jgi:hypothetical protein
MLTWARAVDSAPDSRVTRPSRRKPAAGPLGSIQHEMILAEPEDRHVNATGPSAGGTGWKTVQPPNVRARTKAAHPRDARVEIDFIGKRFFTIRDRFPASPPPLARQWVSGRKQFSGGSPRTSR